jgi:hypothetical protein
VKTFVVAALSLCAVLVAGCGKSGPPSNGEQDKPVAQIIADAKAAARAATTVHIVGTGESGGKPFSIDVSLDAKRGAEGHFTYNGANFDMIRIGDKGYFRGDQQFLKQFVPNAPAGNVGTWFVSPFANTKFAPLEQFTDIRLLTSEIVNPPPASALKKGSTSVVGNQKVLPLIDNADGVTLYVAASGKPYPLQLSTTVPVAGSINLNAWDMPIKFTAPKGAIVVSTLKSK